MKTQAGRPAAPAALAVLGALALLSAAAPGRAEPLQALGPGEGALDIIAWPGYIERGATDPAFDWVTGFERKTGCAVRVKTAATSDEMVALMNEGGFDLVTAPGDASLRLIYGNRVQEVNLDLIPSYKTIDPRLQDAAWHTVEGRHYGTPYQWAPNVLMYNTEAFQPAPDSWRVVFEEMNLSDAKSNKGRVQAFAGPIAIADAALYLMHHRPELGIEDPYELSEEQFGAALELLRRQRAIVSRYWRDPFVQIEDFTVAGTVASSAWPFQVKLLRNKDLPVASVVPKEGATGWADTTMMHIEAPHPNCAYMWMEWSLNRKLQGDLAAWFGSLPVVPAACEGNALLGPEGCKTNGMDDFERIHFWRTPRAECMSQQSCVPYYRWVTSFIALLGGG